MSKEMVKLEEFNALIDEIRATIAERKFNIGEELVTMKHEIGKAIGESNLYREYHAGSGEFIKRVAKELGVSERDVYYCVEFYEQFPEIETALQTIAPERKGLSWRGVIRALGESKDPCGHAEKRSEVWTITRERCSSCGKILKEIRTKDEA